MSNMKNDESDLCLLQGNHPVASTPATDFISVLTPPDVKKEMRQGKRKAKVKEKKEVDDFPREQSQEEEEEEEEEEEGNAKSPSHCSSKQSKKKRDTPKPPPPSRSGFHGASLLAAFSKEYPADGPGPGPDSSMKSAEEEKVDVSTNLIRLSMYHAATALCRMIVLTDTDDKNRFLYSLNSSLLLGSEDSHAGVPPSFELTVLKGSISTHLGLITARYDDEYLLEVHNLPIPQKDYQHCSFPHITSRGSRGTDTDSDGSDTDLLWTMNGFDLRAARVGLGVVSWQNMKALHSFMCTATVPQVATSIGSIGVSAFTNLFSKVLLGLPMRETMGSYHKPMPATLMLQDMLSMCTCPCELVGFAEKDFEDDFVKQILFDLIESDGSGVWIENLFPEKLYSIDENQQQWEAKTLRVVEIRKCSLTSQKNNDPSWCGIAVVLGTFSENFPQQRFLTMHVKDLCRFVREGFPISRSGSDREEEDGEICGFQFKDSFNIINEEEWKTLLLELVQDEEHKSSLDDLHQTEALERAELELVSCRQPRINNYLSPNSAFHTRDPNDMVATLFDKNITAVDMLFDMEIGQVGADDFVLTDDSNSLMQVLTQSSRATASTRRSISMATDSLGTFDTLDSIDMDFLEVTRPPSDREREKNVGPKSPSLKNIGARRPELMATSSSLASVYYSFRNSGDCSSTSSSGNEVSSRWNMENIGTFGISFSDNEEWGSNIYHTNAREQIGKSVMECVILAQRRAELPPCHRSGPGRTDARPSVATQAKKRKGQSKPVSNTFGFDTMSISDHFEDTVVGKSKPPSSNYKLYNKDVDATDLWQEGSIVFIPAKELLSQFFYTIDQPRVERAIKDMIEGSGNNVQPKKSTCTVSRCYFEAKVIHRTTRQITLSVFVLGKEIKRGLKFMEQKCLTEVRDSNVVILQKNDILKTEI